MITAKVIGTDFFDKVLVKFQGKLDRVDQEIAAATQNMESKAKRDAPKDISRLYAAIITNKIDFLKYELTCNVFYAVYMEFGTKGRYRAIPGIDPSQFNVKTAGSGRGFFDNILEWVKRKGFAALKTKSGRASKSLESTIAQEQAAFQIYLSILRHGVKPHPFFFKQLDEERPQLLERLNRIL